MDFGLNCRHFLSLFGEKDGKIGWPWGCCYDMQLLARTTMMMMMRCCRTLTCRSTRGELIATFWAGWVPMGVWRVLSHWKMVDGDDVCFTFLILLCT
jgi:hypothetical protein